MANVQYNGCTLGKGVCFFIKSARQERGNVHSIKMKNQSETIEPTPLEWQPLLQARKSLLEDELQSLKEYNRGQLLEELPSKPFKEYQLVFSPCIFTFLSFGCSHATLSGR